MNHEALYDILIEREFTEDVAEEVCDYLIAAGIEESSYDFDVDEVTKNIAYNCGGQNDDDEGNEILSTLVADYLEELKMNNEE